MKFKLEILLIFMISIILGIFFNIFNFLILCTLIFVLAIFLQIRNLRKKLNFKITVKQINRNLNEQIITILYALLIYLLPYKKGFEFKDNIIPIISLIYILIYEIIIKLYVKKTHPDNISIDGDNLIFKQFFETKKIKITELKIIKLNIEHKWINFQFKDGLDYLKIHFDDYDKTDLKVLIESILKLSNQKLPKNDFVDFLNEL